MANNYRAPMRAQFDKIQDKWGIATKITRISRTQNAQGGFDDTAVVIKDYADNELIWIQPARGNSQVQEKGLDDRTTHLAFQKYSGVALKANDILLPQGDTLPYTVINHFIYESHRLSELQLVVKQ